MNGTTETTGTKRRGRPRDKAPVLTGVDNMTAAQIEDQEETKRILAQIRRASEESDPEIDGLTAEDVLRGVNAKQNKKKYYKLLAQGKIINDENANAQIENNAVVNIRKLKKEAKAIKVVIKKGDLPEEETAKLEARLPRIDKAIGKERTRAAELERRLEN